MLLFKRGKADPVLRNMLWFSVRIRICKALLTFEQRMGVFLWVFCPGCVAFQPCCRKQGIKDGTEGRPRSSLTFHCCVLTPSPCSWCRSLWPLTVSCRACGNITTLPDERTLPMHPSFANVALHQPLNLMRSPDSAIFLFISTVLMKLSQSSGCLSQKSCKAKYLLVSPTG